MMSDVESAKQVLHIKLFWHAQVLLIMELPIITKSNDKGCRSQFPLPYSVGSLA